MRAALLLIALCATPADDALDQVTAAPRNGIGIVWVVSSSGRSSREQTLQASFERRIAPLLERGYTVFAVIHGSAPIFNLQAQVSDVRRAVRFVRHRAAEFGIDGQRLGISGSSAGGLLALAVAMQERDGDPTADDVVERESSRVQAVGCLFAPTDFREGGSRSDAAGVFSCDACDCRRSANDPDSR